MNHVDNSVKIFKPLFWEGRGPTYNNILPTTTLLVDDFHFMPDWAMITKYTGYIKHMSQLMAFQELYKRLQSVSWDSANEFSWPKRVPRMCTHIL